MAPVDLGPEARAEAALGLELDAVLLCEGDRQRGTGDVAALDEDRAEQPAGVGLLRERQLELVLGDEALGHEQLAKGTPDVLRSFHRPYRPEARLLKGECTLATTST